MISPQRTAATALNVPLYTLNNRVIEKLTIRRLGAEVLQRLSNDQEDYLVKKIIQLDHVKEAPSHIRVREIAAKLLEIGGDTKPLGKRWATEFLKRHSQVKDMIRSLLIVRYRHLPDELLLLDNSASIKKQKFIKNYYEARCYPLTRAQKQGSWRAADLSPINRQKELRNPFALLSTQEIPKTPPKQTKKRQFHERTTPQKLSDIHNCIQSFQPDLSPQDG
ncbi:hypothetical protein GcC1_180021 [Golovinomyces cichoracearum]|uniref:HTH CENPB-type domain-containing protein n=1 Tax=Golovinomyces cichoracearum TaxID=62708 RepID=A0A420HN07_9PEZI|nr:hypothetical protein GcC1_180021 [Golovinomyces cichoracearum]